MAVLDTLVCSPSTDIVVKHAVGGGSKNPRRLRMKILRKTCGEGWPVGKLDTCHEGGFPLQIVGFASFFYRRRAEKLQQFLSAAGSFSFVFAKMGQNYRVVKTNALTCWNFKKD